MMNSGGPIVLMSDFGSCDEYVASMKGVLCRYASGVPQVDATHDIPRHDIETGAWILHQYARWFPPKSIHVAVVDPGVGSDRAGVLLETDRGFFIGPDNGLMSWVLHEGGVIRKGVIRSEIFLPDGKSHTFHGRDVFCYAAALLATGTCFDDIALETDSIERFSKDKLEPVPIEGGGQGSLIHVDHFGNCITNIPARYLQSCTKVQVGAHEFTTIYNTFSDVAPGKAVAFVGSHGMLEIAVNQGNAARMLRLAKGGKVYFFRKHNLTIHEEGQENESTT